MLGLDGRQSLVHSILRTDQTLDVHCEHVDFPIELSKLDVKLVELGGELSLVGLHTLQPVVDLLQYAEVECEGCHVDCAASLVV